MRDQLHLLRKYVDLPELDDFKVTFKHTRCKLPTAIVYPNRHEIVIIANIPALVRYALGDLLVHEIAETEFYHEDPQYGGDSHLNPKFQLIEAELKDRILNTIVKEHD